MFNQTTDRWLFSQIFAKLWDGLPGAELCQHRLPAGLGCRISLINKKIRQIKGRGQKIKEIYSNKWIVWYSKFLTIFPIAVVGSVKELLVPNSSNRRFSRDYFLGLLWIAVNPLKSGVWERLVIMSSHKYLWELMSFHECSWMLKSAHECTHECS